MIRVTSDGSTARPPADGPVGLPAGVVRLSDPDIAATSADGPPDVARPIALAGRVTLIHAREKVGKSTIIGAAVAAVTRGREFLGRPTVAGRVLWIGEEPAGDVKSRLAQWHADLDRVYFIRRPSPDAAHQTSLPKLVSHVRPVWAIIDTWHHYLHVHRVKDTAGPGEQGLLIGDVVEVAREFETAITVVHHNKKNEAEYRDSTALGAAVDMIVSMTRGKAPTARCLTCSGRWAKEPLTVVLEPGVGYTVATESEAAAASRPSAPGPAPPITDRLLLHLLQCDPEARPDARTLMAALGCGGRRYRDLRAALDRLVDAGHIDHDRRRGAKSTRERGYALTPEGRVRAETLRDAGFPITEPPSPPE